MNRSIWALVVVAAVSAAVFVTSMAAIGAAELPLYVDYTTNSTFDDKMSPPSLSMPRVRQGLVGDLDGDGSEEVIVSIFRPILCNSITSDRIVVFAPNEFGRYVDVHPGSAGFLNLPIALENFALTLSTANSLPDLVGIDSSYFIRFYRNHGLFNFSDATVAVLGNVRQCTAVDGFHPIDSMNDGSDELFMPGYCTGYYFAQHLNGSFFNVEERMSSFGSLGYDKNSRILVAVADLDGDIFKDIVMLFKLYGGSFSLLFLSNLGGNFTLLNSTYIPNYEYYFSLVAAEFTGDGLVDVLIASRKYEIVLLANTGSFQFNNISNGITLPDCFSIDFIYAAAAGLSNQNSALDLIMTCDDSYSGRVFINNGSGYFFDKTPADMAQVRTSAPFAGPLIANTYPTLMAIGKDINDNDAIVVALSRVAGVVEWNPSLFVEPDKILYTIMYSSVATMDVNHDGCADIYFSGMIGGSGTYYKLFNGVMTGLCNGSFVASLIASTLQPLESGFSIWEDFDLDGVYEAFAAGSDDNGDPVAYYYRVHDDGNLDNLGIANFPGILDFEYAKASVGHLNGDLFIDLVVSTEHIFSWLFVYQNLGNGSFSNVNSSFTGLIAPRRSGDILLFPQPDSILCDLVTIHYSGNQYFYNLGNGSFLSVVSSPSFFLSGNLPDISFGAFLSYADANSDGLVDLFYGGGDKIGFFSRLENGSLVHRLDWLKITSVVPYDGAYALADMDFDGSIDLLYTGSLDYSGDKIVDITAYVNLGNGTYVDRTTEVVGSLPGRYHGSILAGNFAFENRTGFFITGNSDVHCGPYILMPRGPPATNATITSGSSSSGVLPIVPGGSSSPLFAAIGGAVGGATGLFVALCCLFCFCCMAVCCLCCVIAAVLAVLCASVLLVAVALFSAVDAAVVFKLVAHRFQTSADENELELLDATDTGAIAAAAERVREYNIIPWMQIHRLRKLGEGAFGEVFLAEWNGVEVAVKQFKNADPSVVAEFEHEALMMAKVSYHPHVVKFIGASFHDGSIAMVLALCAGGSLLSALEKKKLNAVAKQRVLAEVASALSFLHSLGIVHRDVAARNVLLDGNGGAKLADLGLSRVLEDKGGDQATKSAIGPIRWMAPEAIRERKYSAASDAYSFGVLMSEVWGDGAVPHGQIKSLVEVAVAVLQQDARPAVPAAAPRASVVLMLDLWALRPESRPCMSEVLARLGGIRTAATDRDGDDSGTTDTASDDEYVGVDDL